jgi:hypothetical protein
LREPVAGPAVCCKNEKVPVAMLQSGSRRPLLTEAEKSDRIETDQRIWRVVS